MKKNFWLSLFVVLLFTHGQIADAQHPARIPRIGFLSNRAAPTPSNPYPSADAFLIGLRDLGYVVGKNIFIEYRYADGREERLPDLASELVQIKVEVIVSAALPGIRAAMQATKTIPIVMVTPADPVSTGLIGSLARPGGNVTGVTRLTRELSGKRLELLKETIPGISIVGLVGDEGRSTPAAVKDYEAAARALKIRLQFLGVRAPNPNFEGVFRNAAKGHVRALIPLSGALLIDNANRMAEIAIKYKLPSMNEGGDFVDAGGLMSYSANDADNYKRAAVFVDKILKGAKPADLPVEQPMKFEFIVNLKTAKQIGLTVPPNVLVRADRVIR